MYYGSRKRQTPERTGNEQWSQTWEDPVEVYQYSLVAYIRSYPPTSMSFLYIVIVLCSNLISTVCSHSTTPQLLTTVLLRSHRPRRVRLAPTASSGSS